MSKGGWSIGNIEYVERDVEKECREEVEMKFRVRVQKGSVKGG